MSVGGEPVAGLAGSGWSAAVGAGGSDRGVFGRRRQPAAQDCGRGSASGAAALIEVEIRDGLGPGGIEGGRLVEVEAVVGVEGEVVVGRSACG